MRIGYARVSTSHQYESLQTQREALVAAGCDPTTSTPTRSAGRSGRVRSSTGPRFGTSMRSPLGRRHLLRDKARWARVSRFFAARRWRGLSMMVASLKAITLAPRAQLKAARETPA